MPLPLSKGSGWDCWSQCLHFAFCLTKGQADDSPRPVRHDFHILCLRQSPKHSITPLKVWLINRKWLMLAHSNTVPPRKTVHETIPLRFLELSWFPSFLMLLIWGTTQSFQCSLLMETELHLCFCNQGTLNDRLVARHFGYFYHSGYFCDKHLCVCVLMCV